MIAMLRLSTWLWLALVAAAGSATYLVKYQVTQLDERLARVNRAIDADRAETRGLEAEWSLLNQPARLDQLRRKYLSTLTPLTGANYGGLDQVPFRRGEEPTKPSEQPAPAGGQAAPPAVPGPSIALPGGPALVSAKPGAPR